MLNLFSVRFHFILRLLKIHDLNGERMGLAKMQSVRFLRKYAVNQLVHAIG